MKKHSAFRWILSGLPLLLPAFFLFSGLGKGPKLKGELRKESMLSGQQENAPVCTVDSGAATVLVISKDHENPLFESKQPNRVHLMIQFDEAPTPGQRLHLPQEGVQVCYYEKGDLLMFKTFEPKGWIQFDNWTEKKTVSGSLDLKLVNPHYNMSNSDYHYMGGGFRLKVKAK